jgi:hypothetical protein
VTGRLRAMTEPAVPPDPRPSLQTVRTRFLAILPQLERPIDTTLERELTLDETGQANALVS